MDLCSYGRNKGNPYECKLTLVHRVMSFRNPRTRKNYNTEFVVVDGNYMYAPLIGAQMGLLEVQHNNIQPVSNNEALTASQSTCTLYLPYQRASVS